MTVDTTAVCVDTDRLLQGVMLLDSIFRTLVDLGERGSPPWRHNVRLALLEMSNLHIVLMLQDIRQPIQGTWRGLVRRSHVVVERTRTLDRPISRRPSKASPIGRRTDARRHAQSGLSGACV